MITQIIFGSRQGYPVIKITSSFSCSSWHLQMECPVELKFLLGEKWNILNIDHSLKTILSHQVILRHIFNLIKSCYLTTFQTLHIYLLKTVRKASQKHRHRRCRWDRSLRRFLTVAICIHIQYMGLLNLLRSCNVIGWNRQTTKDI